MVNETLEANLLMGYYFQDSNSWEVCLSFVEFVYNKKKLIGKQIVCLWTQSTYTS